MTEVPEITDEEAAWLRGYVVTQLTHAAALSVVDKGLLDAARGELTALGRAALDKHLADLLRAARIEGMDASANALMREGYPVPACYLDTLIAEERAR